MTLAVGAWYIGIIPHGVSERRFNPLAWYMFICAASLIAAWSAHYSDVLQLLLPAVMWVGLPAAVICFGRAYWTARQSGEINRKWPWSLRLFTLAHLFGTLGLPLLSIEHYGTLSQFSVSLAGLILIIAMVLSHLGFVRRRGHQLHWSMIAVVLLWLVIGGIAIEHSYRANLRFTQKDLLERSQALADILQHNRPELIDTDAEHAAMLTLSLQEICAESDSLTSAFIVRKNSGGAEYLALAQGANFPTGTDQIDPIVFLQRLENGSGSTDRPASMEIKIGGGNVAWVALAGIHASSNHALDGAVGLWVPDSTLQGLTAHSIWVTELIVLIVALVIFCALGGYLHGHLRISQRDALIEINSEVAQRLLRADSPTEIAPWLIEKLHEHLDLVYASFWICTNSNDKNGFNIVSSSPAKEQIGRRYDRAELHPLWQASLCKDRPINGTLEQIGEPIRGLIPNPTPKYWVNAQNISFKDNPWGAIVVVFADQSHSSNRELSKTMESISAAFSAALYREERGESLAASEARFNTMIETSQDGFWDADFENGNYYRSKRWCEMLGYASSPEEAKNLDFHSLVHEQDIDRMKADLATVRDIGRNHRRRLFRIKHRDGRWRWVESSMVELRKTRGPAQRAIGFDRDVSEGLSYEKRLKEAADSAKRANDAKSEFLATVSHELRTPLNSIIGFTHLLSRSALEIDQHEWVESAQSSGEQLLALISDLLDISRIETGHLKLEIAPFELLRICEQAMAHFRHDAIEKRVGLHLNFDTPLIPAWVSGDAVRLRQILTNLVGNAVKFTQTGYVSLTVTRNHDHEWTFLVTDTGPGIRQEETERLFSRFEQIDASSTRSFGGTGLGLAISRELSRAMSGDLTVNSAEGEGSNFAATVVLRQTDGPARRATDVPLAQQSELCVLDGNEPELAELRSIVKGSNSEVKNFATRDELSEHLNKINQPATVLVPRAFRPHCLDDVEFVRDAIGDHNSNVQFVGIQTVQSSTDNRQLFDLELESPIRRRIVLSLLGGIAAPDLSNEVGLDALIPQVDAGQTKLRTLVAEDNPTNRKLMGFMLDQLGIQAEFAENGEIAIERLQEAHYDFALIDIQMPVVDGFGVAEWVRDHWHNHWPKPPLIAVTANVFEETKDKCAFVGMVDFVSKPISLERLSSIISRHCQIEFRVGDSIESIPPFPPFSAQIPNEQSAETDSGDIDWRCFDAVCDLSHVRTDPAVLSNLLVNYNLEAKRTLQQITAISSSDPDRVKRLLHKLKGSSGSLGFRTTCRLISEIHDSEPAYETNKLVISVNLIQTSIFNAIAAVIEKYPSLKP